MSPTASARALRIVSIAYLGVGLVWATAAFAPIDLPARLLFDLLDWPFDGEPATLGRLVRWISAVASGLLIALAALFLLVVAPAVERGERPVVRAGVIALAAWFVVDSVGSVTSGVASNALWNVPFLLGWLLPLLLVRDPAETPSTDAAPAAAREAVRR